MIKSSSKDNKLKAESNTNLSKKYFFLFLQEKLKNTNQASLGLRVRLHKDLLDPPLEEPPSVFPSDTFLQRSFGGISQCHSTQLKNQQSLMLDRLWRKSKQEHSESIILYPARFIDHILRRLSVCYQLQASDHLHAFFHKINIDMKHKSTRSWAIQWAKKKWGQRTKNSRTHRIPFFLFLFFRRQSLRIQHTDIVTKRKYGKWAYKMKCNSTSEGKRDIEATGMPARQPCNWV